MRNKSIEGWWFAEKEKLPYSDGHPVVVGETHTVDGDIVLCENGLHASKRIIDALSYAQGSFIYRVELSGKIVEDDNKMAASHRKYLADGIDCEKALGEFSRQCALDVIHMWEAPDAVIQYLKTGDESLRAAARDAAWTAAWAARATRDVARDAQNERLEKMVRSLFKQQSIIDHESQHYSDRDKRIDTVCDADNAKNEEFCGSDGEGEKE